MIGAMLSVREPRTGMRTAHPSWAHWRAGWERRRMSLRQRVRLCPWCWGFGGAEVDRTGYPAGVPCLSCGRVAGR